MYTSFCEEAPWWNQSGKSGVGARLLYFALFISFRYFGI